MHGCVSSKAFARPAVARGRLKGTARGAQAPAPSLYPKNNPYCEARAQRPHKPTCAGAETTAARRQSGRRAAATVHGGGTNATAGKHVLIPPAREGASAQPLAGFPSLTRSTAM